MLLSFCMCSLVDIGFFSSSTFGRCWLQKLNVSPHKFILRDAKVKCFSHRIFSCGMYIPQFWLFSSSSFGRYWFQRLNVSPTQYFLAGCISLNFQFYIWKILVAKVKCPPIQVYLAGGISLNIGLFFSSTFGRYWLQNLNIPPHKFILRGEGGGGAISLNINIGNLSKPSQKFQIFYESWDTSFWQKGYT